MDLYLDSNKFYNNEAINGGAIYFSERKITEESNNSAIITIKNNNFYENKANEFGGAIYSKYNQLYMASAQNNNITNNKSGIMGAGIYSPNYVNKNLFDISNCHFENNLVNSFKDNYSSEPAYITLNTTINNENIINVGDYFPLNFYLYDEFNNIFNDITKHYSLMSLRLILKTNDNNENLSNNRNSVNNYYLTGNVGSFINGKCELNNIKIYANPNTYYLEPVIENYNGKIKFLFDNIKIKIDECYSDKIKMIDRHGIQYCESPKCHDNCPVGISANCIPYTTELINNKTLNKCECFDGWDGNNCDSKIFVNFE
ncbi:hypothetical protein PIROE2DRAFT_61476 [Piromyces sp. E2]|nr:hypothetical protein PIROE2DRAFT_61476 [Piromyces sp. E2]|eukprot:OUM63122.1 hypothetical protein PIROE2DRAFT_61476 [Piromyces sp. E2]